MADENRIEVSGKLVELGALRYTPAGIPVVRFRISHESKQQEADISRQVSCEISVIAFGREAGLIAAMTLGVKLNIQGFVDRKSRSSSQLMLHVTHIEFRN